MKKIIFLLLTGIVMSAGAMAQSVQKEENKLKNTIKNKKEDKHEVGNHLAHFRMKAALHKRKEVRHHRRSINRQAEHLEARGVKHPVYKAKAQAKKEKDAKNNNN